MAKAGCWAAHLKPSYTLEACCVSIAWVNGELPSTVIASAACLATISPSDRQPVSGGPGS